MSWKKTDLERLKAASITDRLRKSRAPARYGRDSALRGWHKQFKLDQQAIVALADVSYQLEGGKVDAIRRGVMAFVVRKDASRWRIAAIRSIPER